MRSPAELTELYRARGLKVTPQRLGVFRALHGDRGHPTAEAVHARVRAEQPTVSLRTVYQVLNDLAAMGEVGRLDLGTGSSRFDPNLEPHHHLVCEACGRVHDVPAGPTDVPVSAAGHGFRVSSTEVTFRGRCASCLAADAAPEPGASPLTPTTSTDLPQTTDLPTTTDLRAHPSTDTRGEVTNHG